MKNTVSAPHIVALNQTAIRALETLGCTLATAIIVAITQYLSMHGSIDWTVVLFISLAQILLILPQSIVAYTKSLLASKDANVAQAAPQYLAFADAVEVFAASVAKRLPGYAQTATSTPTATPDVLSFTETPAVKDAAPITLPSNIQIASDAAPLPSTDITNQATAPRPVVTPAAS